MSLFRRTSEVVLEAENVALRSALLRLELINALLVRENNRLKSDACAAAALGDARARSQTRHPAGRTIDDCDPRGMERPQWN